MVWSVLVALRLVQPLYDFIIWAHMIHLQLTIGPFDPVAAATLIVVTLLVGCAMGFAFRPRVELVHRSVAVSGRAWGDDSKSHVRGRLAA
jgi:hypothetical protein